MAPSFEDAFRAASERQAHARHEHGDRERRAQDGRSQARAIAEPALRALAEPVRRQLEASRIPTQTHTDRSRRGLFASRGRHFWPLAPSFRGAGETLNIAGWSSDSLVLTRDGHFTMDYRRPGSEGFEALLTDIDMADASRPPAGTRSGSLFVDRATRLVHYFGRLDNGVDEQAVRELSTYLGDLIVQLELVERNRRNGTAYGSRTR
ncbi:hypothetical protein B4N89_42370 [Embleya scabrispora]|uniref:Uncharacterized protein n=1 Tax=Embleya scabrispora TaxID=159449 RepID=A0A1T3NKF7_9ACTN|nr:hypothetical protein [Embleya scabrispora]OPC77195.1 hypothetical protein B4N89_42370 [Embleya scabrispora]